MIRSLIALVLLLVAGVAEAQAPGGGGGSTTPPTTYPLTVNRSGTGNGTVTGAGPINCGTQCSASYASGVTVQLFATPISGSSFTGWSGACAGTGSCPVAMTTSKTVTATFTFAGWSLAWNDNSTNETGFELQRRTPCTSGTYALIASPTANATAYTDTTAVAGTQYQYRIRAVNSSGQSTYSNEVCTP